MVRVAGLKDQVKAGYNKPENKAKLTPKQQLKRISEVNHRYVKEQYEIFDKLLSLLEKEGIFLTTVSDLSTDEINELESFFDEYIFPVLTPLSVDAYHPFPKLLNKSLNLAVTLNSVNYKEEKNILAIVQVPALLDRFIKIGNQHKFVLLEDVVAHFIYKLFRGFEVQSITEFRITRNADLTIHEEGARDLLKEIEKELKTENGVQRFG